MTAGVAGIAKEALASLDWPEYGLAVQRHVHIAAANAWRSSAKYFPRAGSCARSQRFDAGLGFEKAERATAPAISADNGKGISEEGMIGKLLKVACLAIAVCAGNAYAQDYPAKPVKIMVPYAAGGVPDVLARTVGQRLSEALSHQFVVENRGGAGGIAAVMAVVTAPADGYTLIMADPSQTAINASLFTKLPYDTLRDLVPISIVANSTQYVAGSPRFANFAEFIAYAKANPGKLTYGSAGIGSVHHIGMESIKAALGLDIVHVPYKGSGQSVPAFVSGEVQAVFASLPALTAHVKAGKAKLLAVTSLKRSDQTPEVPAVSEFIPGYDFTTAIGLLAPAGTPAPVVSKLAGEVAKAMKNPEVGTRLTALGMEAVGSTPEAYAAVIRRDLEKYSTAVKISGAKAN